MLDYVLKNCFHEDKVYIPANINLLECIFFAIDNTDFHRDTKDGKMQWHFNFQNICSAALEPSYIMELL